MIFSILNLKYYQNNPIAFTRAVSRFVLIGILFHCTQRSIYLLRFLIKATVELKKNFFPR